MLAVDEVEEGELPHEPFDTRDHLRDREGAAVRRPEHDQPAPAAAVAVAVPHAVPAARIALDERSGQQTAHGVGHKVDGLVVREPAPDVRLEFAGGEPDVLAPVVPECTDAPAL